MAAAKPRPDLSTTLDTLRRFDVLDRVQAVDLSPEGVSVRLGPKFTPPQQEDPRRQEAADKELEELIYASSGG